MPDSPSVVLPKRLPHRVSPAIRVAPALLEAARGDINEVLRKLQSSTAGLSEEEVERRLRQYGHNVVAQEQRYTRMRLLGKAMINPLVILLLVLAILSYLTGDVRA